MQIKHTLFALKKKKTSATPHHVPLRAMLDRIMRLKRSFPPLVVQFQRIISKDLDNTEQRECFARTSKIQDLNPFYSFLIFLLLDIPRRERRRLGMLLVQSPILGLHSIQNRVGGPEQVEDDQYNLIQFSFYKLK